MRSLYRVMFCANILLLYGITHSDWTGLHKGQVRGFVCLQSNGQTPGEVRSSVSELGRNTEEACLEGLPSSRVHHNRWPRHDVQAECEKLAPNYWKTLLFTGATQRSFIPGQATDELIITKIKRKIGNNSQSQKQKFNSPASVKSRRASAPGTPSSTRLSDAEWRNSKLNFERDTTASSCKRVIFISFIISTSLY